MAIKMITSKHKIKALVLEEKKRIANDMIAELNASIKTGDLRNTIGYIEKDGKIVIYKGMDVIQIL